MTVAGYFNMRRIFDRRNIDKIRKVRRSKSPSQEDELSPDKEAASASADGSTRHATNGAAGDIDSAANDIAASLELPRPPPASTTPQPSPGGGFESEMSNEDVPCEGTFATHGNISSSSIRGRAWSDASFEDEMPSRDFQCEQTVEFAAEPVMMPAASSGHPRPSSSSCSPPARSCVLCLVGDSLELMMAPGDVLAIKGQGRLTEIGTAHGMLGHVVLVLSPPTNVLRYSQEGLSLQAVWPDKEVEEIWRVCTLESTRAETGLHEAEMLLYVDRSEGKLILIGELQNDGTLVISEHEPVELWQSPAELRSQLRVDLMSRVRSEMKANEASWSHVTVARAVFSSAQLTSGAPGTPPEQTLDMVKACWMREPICTSVVIIFWQRYLYELAASAVDNTHQHTLDLILRWMPLKADRGLPGDLLGAMREVGWVTVPQVPRIFRPMVFSAAPTHNGPSSHGGYALPDAACEARALAVAREMATGAA